MHASKTFSKCYRKLAVILGICSVLLSMASTEFYEAVACALPCVGLRDLTLNPKQKEALIHLYNYHDVSLIIDQVSGGVSLLLYCLATKVLKM